MRTKFFLYTVPGTVSSAFIISIQAVSVKITPRLFSDGPHAGGEVSNHSVPTSRLAAHWSTAVVTG